MPIVQGAYAGTPSSRSVAHRLLFSKDFGGLEAVSTAPREGTAVGLVSFDGLRSAAIACDECSHYLTSEDRVSQTSWRETEWRDLAAHFRAEEEAIRAAVRAGWHCRALRGEPLKSVQWRCPDCVRPREPGTEVQLAEWLHLPEVSGLECVVALRRAGFAIENTTSRVVDLTKGNDVVQVPLAERLDPEVLIMILQHAGLAPAEFIRLLDGGP